jgi:phosphotransferase system, enzyme I, PtsP
VELKTLRRILLEVSAAADLSTALVIVVERIRETLQADAASIFLNDEEHGEYVLMAADGMAVERPDKIRLKYGQGLVGMVGEREEPINIDKAQEHPQYVYYPGLEESAYHAFLGVPIMHGGELLGILIAQQKASRHFAEEEEGFLLTLSTQLANQIALARAKGQLAEVSKRGRKKTPIVLEGVSGSSGIAIGKAVVVFPPADLEAVPDLPADDADEQVQLFEVAIAKARDEIHVLGLRAKSAFSVAEHALFDAYSRILDSRTLMSEIETEIRQGLWAQAALKRVIKKQILQFEASEDCYFRERAADFRDLGRRILAHLQANKKEAPEYPKKTILVSGEVTATSMLEVPQGRLVGIVSGSGSSNSHVAILARALGVPTVMGVTGKSLTELSGKDIVVDGYNGQIYVSPSATLKKEFRVLIEEEQQFDEELQGLRDLPAETQDGHNVSLFLNTGLATDGALSLSVGAEGVGLYRTEMPFMLRDRFPSEEEQRIMYRQLLTTFSPRPVTMRTLDIGGDKSLPYFPVEEDNPFLGWRGIRVTLDHPEIFLQQVRAMLHANEGLGNLSIMLPMISSVWEVEASIRLIRQACQELAEEGVQAKMPKIGLMIEVPSAVYQSYVLAKRVDFLSVGSNDLIQYLLAVDRNNPRVAALYDSFHPAVLCALQQVVKAAHKAGKKVSICGELASDPVAVLLLLGMGFDALSMNARGIPKVKHVIRNFTLERTKVLVKEVLEMDDSKEIRNHMESALEEAGLGGLIRAGR